MQPDNPYLNEFRETRYSNPVYAYGTQPNEFSKHGLNNLPPGRLLVLADGEGRNVVYPAP